MAERERREYGTGSISKHSRGGYRGQYYDSDGKRRSVYGKTKREVELKLRRVLAASERGEAPASGRLTVEDYLDQWFERGVQSGRWLPKTQKLYGMFIRHHLNPALGKRKLGKLSVPDVNRLLADKRDAGLSLASVNRIRGCLRVALNDAIRNGYTNKNVAALSDAPGERRSEQRWLNADEAALFIAAAREDRLSALWIIAVTSGLRQGEVLGLAWDDVDLDTGTLRVRLQLQRVDGRLRRVPLKSERARRIVPLATIAVNALLEHRDRQREERAQADEWPEPGLVFTTSVGTPIEPRNIVRRFKALLRKAGLPNLRFHDLRHSAASALIATGADIRTVSDLLGHSETRLTMDVYGHLSEGQRRNAVSRLDGLYGA